MEVGEKLNILKKRKVIIAISLIIVIAVVFLFVYMKKDNLYNDTVKTASSYYDDKLYESAWRLIEPYFLEPKNDEDRELFDKIINDYQNSLYDIVDSLEIVDKNIRQERNYVYALGAVKNNGTRNYKFIEVKVTYYDGNNNVLDTDWTYAVGDEGLEPQERKQFEIMTKRSENIKNFTIEIKDFSIE